MKVIITCKQASQIISQSLDVPLPWLIRVQLKLHLFICGPCTRFARQLRLLSDAVKSLCLSTENDTSIQLNLDAKTRMMKIISDAAP